MNQQIHFEVESKPLRGLSMVAAQRKNPYNVVYQPRKTVPKQSRNVKVAQQSTHPVEQKTDTFPMGKFRHIVPSSQGSNFGLDNTPDIDAQQESKALLIRSLSQQKICEDGSIMPINSDSVAVDQRTMSKQDLNNRNSRATVQNKSIHQVDSAILLNDRLTHSVLDSGIIVQGISSGEEKVTQSQIAPDFRIWKHQQGLARHLLRHPMPYRVTEKNLTRVLSSNLPKEHPLRLLKPRSSQFVYNLVETSVHESRTGSENAMMSTEFMPSRQQSEEQLNRNKLLKHRTNQSGTEGTITVGTIEGVPSSFKNLKQ